MNCSTFRTHWVNYTDLSSYNDYLLAAGEITTGQQEQALVVEMLQQYCDRVARYSTAGYSVVIRNIIHYINLHLKEDLTLSTLAARFNLSRSYLSGPAPPGGAQQPDRLCDPDPHPVCGEPAPVSSLHDHTGGTGGRYPGYTPTCLFKRTIEETLSHYAR